MSPTATFSSHRLRPLRALVVFVAGLVAVELGARAIVTGGEPSKPASLVVPGARRESRPSLRGDGETVDPATLVADPRLLWRNRPLAARSAPVIPSLPHPAASPGRHPAWTLRVNAGGFRSDAPTAAGPAPETYRILCIGDSVTFGFNVDQGSDYPAVLERVLEERHAGHRFEVINAGVPEWSWVQGQAFLLRDGFPLHPDLVIAAHGTADQARAGFATDSERLWLNHRQRESRGSSLAALASRSVALRLLDEWLSPPASGGGLFASPGCRLQAAAGSPCRRVPLAEIGATVHDIGEATKAAGVDLLLLNVDFSASPASEAVHRTAIRDDLHYLDRVARVKAGRLHDQMVRSRDLGLAMPRVPMVPFGHIGPPLVAGRGPRVRFRVMRSAGAAAEGELRVRGSGPEESGFRFEETMRDDGRDADEKAGDGVFSAFVEIPSSANSLRYQFFAGDAAEFDVPLEVAASNADRSIRFNRDSDAPVEIFGQRYRMSDDLHPDADGQRLLAEDVAQAMESLPSFRRFAGLPAANKRPGR